MGSLGAKDLTLRVYKHPNGWVYMVFEGDGSVPGSMVAGGMQPQPEVALEEGLAEYTRAWEIALCDHDWSLSIGHYPVCSKCGANQYWEGDNPTIDPKTGRWLDKPV